MPLITLRKMNLTLKVKTSHQIRIFNILIQKKDIKVTVIEGFENSFEQKTAEASYIADTVVSLLKRDNAAYKRFCRACKIPRTG